MKRISIIALCVVAVCGAGAVAASSAVAEVHPCGLISKAAIAKAFNFAHVYVQPSGVCEIAAWQGKPAKPPARQGTSAYRKFSKEVQQKLLKGLAADVTVSPVYGEDRPGEWNERLQTYLPAFGTCSCGTHFEPPTYGAEFAKAYVGAAAVGGRSPNALEAAGAWWTTARPGWVQLEVIESKTKPVRAEFEKVAATVVPAFERVLVAGSY
jgi:hypothetical protein